MNIEDLKGKKIVGIKINKAKDVIELRTLEQESIWLVAYGDCCSHSWFEHINGVDALMYREIEDVLVRAMPDGQDTEGDLIQFYGWSLVTKRGHFDIEMRNRSNGYYGGDLNVSREAPGIESLEGLAEAVDF